ncbi:MAG TPA: phytanoyl-CoA dioxygenase family protein [Candidatus Sulfotelmatobacter sp.]
MTEEIDKNGFAIHPGAIADEQLDRLLEDIDKQSARRSRAGIRHALALDSVASFARQPILTEVAKAVLGPDAFPFRATMFDKSPRSNWLVVWHQDTALPFRERIDLPGWGPWSVKDGISYAHAPAVALRQVVALRVHLDESNSSNGPLRVLPETHTLSVLSDDEIHDLTERIDAIDCIVPRGGILAIRPLTVHSSSKSHSEMPRRVLHIEYAASPSIAQPLRLAIA